MQPTLTLTRDNVTPTLRAWGVAMRKEMPEVVNEVARRTTREVIAITPPASAGMTGRDAYNQGRAKIARQMNAVLAPVRLKRKRKERHPDVADAYRARAKFRGSGVGVTVSRGAKAYVDIVKFRALLKHKVSRIGLLASGWSAAAVGLKVALPAWIARHGTPRGRLLVVDTAAHYRVTVTNFAPDAEPNVRAELARRVPYALRYAINGMRRNVDAMALRTARGAGIRVLRTPVGGSLAA